ncbi:putative beta-lysine N-acetyltransferase [Bacillus inaquosorum]|uniref:putative beta-lysine N-acetyltransferase n=1 Tax=Bacillus inaquosorum TaxID=483913 RepID=UPI0022808852|nr:putative beta-lysine N-acetyltransferase [Bacillus inaquosorum]MCY8377089.1 putative beta-lysine N-acetyltransferase [Bacillus inaquosorum]MCY8850920.1 putative beta-lysine N-acetyltransferase [Bacillus inaquosorum]MCY8868954.1 putative beta-lysine N-acetyltransferase [Bacillus inaquosorum]MCY8997780.1 putative beta-lysine N-acetyltransferase [Bacillus inaquosorum]MCY9015188.1 putative beta-lysine N-acetyltransferase [Bacillus inaquosorum]
MLKSIKSNGVTAVLDHDDFNKRIRVVRYDGAIEKALPDIVAAAKVEDAEKIIVYTKQHDEAVLAKHLFVPEGFLKGYYLGHPACLMVRYLTEKRRQTDSYIEEQETIEALYRTAPHHRSETTPVFTMRKAKTNDMYQLSMLYKKVFRTYPTPVFDPAYIEKTMNENTMYYVMFDHDRLISAANADINPELGHAEITDCAVLPEYRGRSLTSLLIGALEKEMAEKDIFHVFSLARAASFGMNAVLYHSGYQYGGRLINNCYIAEGLENMNIWCKHL